MSGFVRVRERTAPGHAGVSVPPRLIPWCAGDRVKADCRSCRSRASAVHIARMLHAVRTLSLARTLSRLLLSVWMPRPGTPTEISPSSSSLLTSKTSSIPNFTNCRRTGSAVFQNHSPETGPVPYRATVEGMVVFESAPRVLAPTGDHGVDVTVLYKRYGSRGSKQLPVGGRDQAASLSRKSLVMPTAMCPADPLTESRARCAYRAVV